MTIPPPVDLNKLKGILGNAKNIMKKVETGDFETGHVDSRALTEDGVMELQAEGVRRPIQQQQQYDGQQYEQAVKNSGMPESVKRLMLERPIPQATPNYTFSLDDVADLSDEKPLGRPSVPKTNPKQQIIRENYTQSSDMVTVSKAELKEMVSAMVNERILEFMAKTNNKAITEDAVKKTINLLIKEGKLTPKKKTL
jgi:hypothetical protein